MCRRGHGVLNNIRVREKSDYENIMRSVTPLSIFCKMKARSGTDSWMFMWLAQAMVKSSNAHVGLYLLSEEGILRRVTVCIPHTSIECKTIKATKNRFLKDYMSSQLPVTVNQQSLLLSQAIAHFSLCSPQSLERSTTSGVETSFQPFRKLLAVVCGNGQCCSRRPGCTQLQLQQPELG